MLLLSGLCLLSMVSTPPETFLQHRARIFVGQETEPMEIVKEPADLHYGRVTGSDFQRGDIRLRGEILDIWMPSRDILLE